MYTVSLPPSYHSSDRSTNNNSRPIPLQTRSGGPVDHACQPARMRRGHPWYGATYQNHADHHVLRSGKGAPEECVVWIEQIRTAVCLRSQLRQHWPAVSDQATHLPPLTLPIVLLEKALIVWHSVLTVHHPGKAVSNTRENVTPSTIEAFSVRRELSRIHGHVSPLHKLGVSNSPATH